MKSVLFVVSSATAYRLQKVFAAYCVTQGQSVDFVCDFPPNDLYAEVCADAHQWGARVCSLDEWISAGAKPKIPLLRTEHPLRTFLFRYIVKTESPVFLHLLGERLAAAQKLLNEWRPHALLVSEDGISGPASLLTAARSLDIPTYDLPYGYGTQADLDIALEEKAVAGELLRAEGHLGRWIRWLAPAWIKKGRFAGSLMFPQAYIAAREALDMTLRNAWIVHGGSADHLFAESEQMNSLYLDEGIPAAKLLLTGSPYCDTLVDELKSHPSASKAFRQSRPITPGVLKVLVSWPTSYHASRAQHCEFDSYETMTFAFLGWLHTLPHCELTVSLHPAVPTDMRGKLERRGIHISDEYIIRLIPRHDIYVSYFSSTQRWALACGKPVVNYDAYGVKLDVYTSAPGFYNASTFSAFQAHLLRLTSNSEEFLQACVRQSSDAHRWGLTDGKCMQRILNAIRSAS